MRRRVARFIRSEASRAAAWPVLPGRKRHASPRGPFYLVGSVARRRVARFTRSEASRAAAWPVLPRFFQAAVGWIAS